MLLSEFTPEVCEAVSVALGALVVAEDVGVGKSPKRPVELFKLFADVEVSTTSSTGEDDSLGLSGGTFSPSGLSATGVDVRAAVDDEVGATVSCRVLVGAEIEVPVEL